MKRTIILWSGKSFPGVYLTIFEGTPDEKNVLLSVVELENELVNEDKTECISPEAAKLDDQITFYVDRNEIYWSEERLVKKIEEVLAAYEEE